MPASGETIKAAILNEGTYTPVLTADTTNPTLGSGSTQSGWWKRIDNLIVGEAFIRFGTSGTNAGSGSYAISLPYAADTTFMVAGDGMGVSSQIGTGRIRDNSTLTNSTTVICTLGNGANIMRLYPGSGSTSISDSSPFTWAASDAIFVRFRYQADSTAF